MKELVTTARLQLTSFPPSTPCSLAVHVTFSVIYDRRGAAPLATDLTMIQLFEFPSNDLIGELSSQIHALLSGEWPEDALNEGDYYRTHGAPKAVLVIRNATHVLAHLAIYQRQVEIGEETLEIGMLGGIVVAPEHRRKSHSRALVRHAHEWLKGRHIPFSILFTHEPRLYTSSGYQLMQNATRFVDSDGTLKTLAYTGGMYAELSQRRWPNQTLDLRGRTV